MSSEFAASRFAWNKIGSMERWTTAHQTLLRSTPKKGQKSKLLGLSAGCVVDCGGEGDEVQVVFGEGA